MTVLVLLYGVLLCSAGFWLGRAADSGLLDMRQRWFENQHFWHGLNPYAVMAGSAQALDGVPCVYRGGYPPWSYVIGSLFVPPVALGTAQSLFTVVQLASLAGVVFLVYKGGLNLFASGWVAALFCGLFLASPGVATDLKWGNYTTICMFALLACVLLCGSRKASLQWLAAACYAIAFIKPQLAALFGLVLLYKRRWMVCLPAGALILSCTCIASMRLHEEPWVLLRQLATSTVHYDEVYSYAKFYNYGFFDVLKMFGVPVPVVAKLDFVIGVFGVTGLLKRYAGRVPEVSLWAIPATFVPLWAYNQKYDWLIIFWLVFAFGAHAFRSGQETRKRNGLMFMALALMSIVLTFKLMWFGYVINCLTQFALRLFWLCALVFLLQEQMKNSKGRATAESDGQP